MTGGRGGRLARATSAACEAIRLSSVDQLVHHIGDALAVMQRPGNAGSFTAADHFAVLEGDSDRDPLRRTDVLVSIDGAGASQDVIVYLSR